MGLFDRLRHIPMPDDEPEPEPAPDEFFEPEELYERSGSIGRPFVSHRRTVTMLARPAGELELPSGRLAACDPYFARDTSPFNVTVAPGRYPVELRVARFEDSGDQRVAAAIMRLREGEPVAFEEARADSWPTDPLPPGDFYGFPVDSATACLASPEALEAFAEALDGDPAPGEDDLLMCATEPTYVHTWTWANLDLGRANLIAFSSGFGDGVYPLYWGRDASGEIVCAMCDLQVLDPPAGD